MESITGALCANAESLSLSLLLRSDGTRVEPEGHVERDASRGEESERALTPHITYPVVEELSYRVIVTRYVTREQVQFTRVISTQSLVPSAR